MRKVIRESTDKAFMQLSKTFGVLMPYRKITLLISILLFLGFVAADIWTQNAEAQSTPYGAKEYSLIQTNEKGNYYLFRHLVGNGTICYVAVKQSDTPSISCVKDQ